MYIYVFLTENFIMLGAYGEAIYISKPIVITSCTFRYLDAKSMAGAVFAENNCTSFLLVFFFHVISHLQLFLLSGSMLILLQTVHVFVV
jgi:hypothetical protein